MPKEVIDIAKLRADRTKIPRKKTFMLQGGSRSGKTRFLGTFPRVVVICEVAEGGWTTFLDMPEEAFYEPDHQPIVYKCGPEDWSFWDAWKDIKAHRDRDPNWAWTLGIDSLKSYADAFRLEIDKNPPKTKGGAIDTRAIWGMMETHLRYIQVTIHQQWPDNVVWTALEKEPDTENNKPGGVMIGGQTDQAAPSRCDFWWRLVDAADGKRVYTKGMGGIYPGGGRDGGRVLNPLPAANPVIGPTYRDFELAYYGNYRVNPTTQPTQTQNQTNQGETK